MGQALQPIVAIGVRVASTSCTIPNKWGWDTAVYDFAVRLYFHKLWKIKVNDSTSINQSTCIKLVAYLNVMLCW